MKIIQTELDGCVVFEMPLFGDKRGYFMESFNQKKLEDVTGGPFEIRQVNMAKSAKNVLRGMHFQIPPFAQSKIVGVNAGSVVDVVVDIRISSPTYGRYHKQLLDRPGLMMLVPRGFAHGYVTLEDDTQFFYYVDEFYAPEHEEGLLFSDQSLDIDWGVADPDLIVSDKDKMQPTLDQLKEYFK